MERVNKLYIVLFGGFCVYILYKMEEKEIIAKTLFGEARGEGFTGMLAVASVIQNRLKKGGWFGGNFKQICQKPYQFSCWNESDPNRALLDKVDKNNKQYTQALYIAGMLENGENLYDYTNGATHYHSKYITPPSWAKDFEKTAEIGNHIFYKERS